MPPFNQPSIVRLRVLPDDPAAVLGRRPRGPHGQTSRRPHSDAQVAAVRRLIEQSTLTYGEIAAKTGVGRASICRWTRDGGWRRPVFAPRATDTIPRPRAGQKLKLRLLAERLRTLAERTVRELEETPGVDLDKLMQALEVLKMARLEAMGRSHRRRAAIIEHAMSARTRDEITRRALNELRHAGIDVERAPQAALDLLIDARTPPKQDHPALRRRGWRGR
jgi:hypothetical protein